MSGQEPSSSNNWSVARKSISLPDFCVKPGQHFNAEDEQDDGTSFIKINSDFLNNETHILIRSPSPSIVITPPPIDRAFRYAHYFKSTPYPKMKLRNNRKDNSVSEIPASYNRWPSRLFKRRNAVSTNDLDYLRNSGRSLLLLPNEMSESLELKSKNPMALKLKKRVTFTNSNPVSQQNDEFGDNSVYTSLDRITSDCIQMFGELRTTHVPSTSMDTSVLANDFRDSCQISLTNGQPMSTETLCTRFSAMPSNNAITTIAPSMSSSTSTAFISCNNGFGNMSCLNL